MGLPKTHAAARKPSPRRVTFASRSEAPAERSAESLAGFKPRTGVWQDGQRRKSWMLKPGDIIEVGTVAFVFNGGDPDKPSNPAPFGMGLGVAELMDTLCTDGIRPSVYSKKQAARKSEFAMRVRNRQIREEQAEEDADLPSFAYSAAEARKSQEWAELDIEVKIAEAQEASLRDWRAPIFNPSPELFRPTTPPPRLPTAPRSPPATEYPRHPMGNMVWIPSTARQRRDRACAIQSTKKWKAASPCASPHRNCTAPTAASLSPIPNGTGSRMRSRNGLPRSWPL